MVLLLIIPTLSLERHQAICSVEWTLIDRSESGGILVVLTCFTHMGRCVLLASTWGENGTGMQDGILARGAMLLPRSRVADLNAQNRLHRLSVRLVGRRLVLGLEPMVELGAKVERRSCRHENAQRAKQTEQ